MKTMSMLRCAEFMRYVTSMVEMRLGCTLNCIQTEGILAAKQLKQPISARRRDLLTQIQPDVSITEDLPRPGFWAWKTKFWNV